MGVWKLECPKGGVYKCEGHYEGGHGEPFSLHCDSIRTVKAPSGGACVDAPKAESENPRTRGFLPHGLTEEEKASPELRRKLARCIRKTELRCCGGYTTDYAKCSCNPVAVCRTSVKVQ